MIGLRRFGNVNPTAVSGFLARIAASGDNCKTFDSTFVTLRSGCGQEHRIAQMHRSVRRRRFTAMVRGGVPGGAVGMGIYYRPETSLREVPGGVIMRSPAKERPFGRSAEGEAERDEWNQPRLTGDAQQRILALYDEYRPGLFRYLRSMRLSQEWAEEVIQETFMRLTFKLLERDDIENINGWVVRVAHNLAVDVLKQERGKIDADEPFLIENRADPSLNPEEVYSENERSIQMTLALRAMKPQQRQCFQMRAHGFRYREIGLAMGISAQRAALVVKQVAVRLASICG